MFEPEYIDAICPKCRHRRVYFDRQIGHYCMFCGHQFSPQEVERLLEQELSETISDKQEQPVETNFRHPGGLR